MTTLYPPPTVSDDAGAAPLDQPDATRRPALRSALAPALSPIPSGNHSDQEAPRQPLRTTLASRNISVRGRRTSVRLEPDMWRALHQIADREGGTIHDICSLVALRKNTGTSLTAAIRVFVMLYYKAAATEDGHVRAGHGDIARMRERAEAPKAEKLPFSMAARPPGLPEKGP